MYHPISLISHLKGELTLWRRNETGNDFPCLNLPSRFEYNVGLPISKLPLDFVGVRGQNGKLTRT